MSSLSHHGIKGQRWGVRRFQNKDGTRTAAGKDRDVKNNFRKKLAKAGMQTVTIDMSYAHKPSDLAKQNSNFIDKDVATNILKKGSVVNRFAGDNEPLDDKRKYVSFTPNDKEQYYNWAQNDMLGIALTDTPHLYEYELTKDIRIASGKAVSKIICDDLKDKKIADNPKYDAIQGRTYAEAIQKDMENTAIQRGVELAKIGRLMVSDKEKRHLDEIKKEADQMRAASTSTRQAYLNDGSKAHDRFMKRMNRTKYDAYVDLFDTNYNGYGAEYPLVIMNPKDKLRLKKKTNINDVTFGAQHTSIGGTMYIEGNALILGDSSYLEHHGIRGQRWGVRRFQNRDGSLTNAGRKRLGYATKGAAQTVSKAFKAGAKAGGNAVKAVKAHHEKKEAEKLQKKKEKASKTRLGVMANKDLFTNEEIRKLNERFKLEDEMKMATLQKGVEIAKAVGTIAQNVGTVAKTYEDVTGQSLSPIKRKAAEEKARQDKEDRERRIAREDAEEARKAAKEERDIAIHEQTLRKAIAAADTQEFTAQKTKAEADSSVLDAIKKGQDFNGGGDATGQSWMEKAKNGGKNPFDDMIANRDPEYAQIRKEHDEKVARKERIAELERREKEREAEKAAASKQSQPQQKQGGGDDDALFSQKGSLPIDKDRYRNNRAMEKAKQVKEDAAEERAKKQDEKAVSRTIDDTIEANRSFKEVVRAQDPHAYDRGVAKDYIKGKLNNLPNALADLNPINRAAKKIADKATKEEEAQVRKSMKDQYDQMVKNEGRDEANYVMYNTRVANLQAQGYSERKAKQIADSNPTFSAKRNRKKEYYEKVGELESTHRKNAEELHKANKELTDYYYKLVNGPGYDPGTPKREALDRTYRQKRGELERLEKDNNEMLEKGTKEAKKILEHSFSIQNGVLFIDSSDSLAHHGVKGQRWGVRRFQNEDGSLTEKGRKHYEKAIDKLDRKQVNSDNRRGALERRHPYAVTASAVLVGSAYAALLVASAANPATIALGSAVAAAVSALGTHVDYSVAEAWEARGTKRRQKKRKEYEEMLNHDGLIVSDGTLYLEHHGIKGQRWGVRRFQNPDGTRTEAGKKHDAKIAAKAERKQAKADMKAAKAAAKAKAKDIKLTEKAENLRKREIERYEKMAVKQPRHKEAYEVMSKHAKESDRSELLQINTAANIRGTGQAIVSALVLSTFVPTPIAVAGGIAVAKAMKMNNVDYARTVTTNAKLNKEARERKLKEAQSIKLEHSSGGMLIQNGTLFIDAGEPYLEHHGVKGMKWGKHLMAGKSVDAEGGGGGGFAEDDEKLKEMAKKAGMSVAEYRQKFASKLGSAAGKVGEKSAKEKKRLQTYTSAEAKRISVKDKHLVINGNRFSGTRSLAVGETGEKPKSFKEKAYNALGGKYKTQAAEAHREMVQKRNDADDKARRANAQGRAANANKKAGNVREYMANKEGARQLDSEAKGARLSQWEATKKANRAQWKYDHSIAGLYDKATGKYKQAHKKTTIPKMVDRFKYEYKDGPNSKLFKNGKGKAKTAKEQAKAEVWNAADHQIKAKDYNYMANTLGGNANYYGRAFKDTAAKEARLAEGSYRRAAALGKQASSETSTSSRPRARKKKYTSGGSGVTVRRPGRKPVSRTKRVTQSSTGVKRRGSTGTGRTVQRGA